MTTPQQQLSDSLLAACKAAGIEKPRFIIQQEQSVWHVDVKPEFATSYWAALGGVGFIKLDHPPYTDNWQDSLLEFRDYALIRKCNKCQAVTAIDLIGSDENEKELQYDGETVYRVSKEEALGLVIDLCKCECEQQGEPLADVLAPHGDLVGDDTEMLILYHIADTSKKIDEACEIAYHAHIQNGNGFRWSRLDCYRAAWQDALAWKGGSDE